MISNAELQPILNVQPLLRMQRFAAALGWNGLQLCHVRIPDEEPAYRKWGLRYVNYYEAGSPRFRLQINTWPHGQTRQHQAVVQAERYGISSTPFVEFELPAGEADFDREANRLRPLIGRESFRHRRWRDEFAANHPDRVMRRGRKRTRWARLDG